METLQPAQQRCRGVRLLPDTGDVLVGLGESRVDVDLAEHAVQSDSLFHRQDELGDQVAGVLARPSRWSVCVKSTPTMWSMKASNQVPAAASARC